MEKKCPKCGKIHLTEVDKMGVAYIIFCKICQKQRKKTNSKESIFFAVYI